MELLFILGLPILTAILSLVPTKNRHLTAALTIFSTLLVFITTVLVALKLNSNPKVVAVQDWLECDAFGGLLLVIVSFVGLTAVSRHLIAFKSAGDMN